ncbi:MAG: FAD-dependent thymidylate synthase [Clostridia bacterium]|nr:FAD-dependent thymidylate synthase [Clostridia bacterium]
MLKVELIAYTPEPEKVVAAAAKLCYSSSGASDIMDGLTEEKTANFLDMLSGMGHDSPTEHASFTFAVEGVSRSLLAQLTRHRIASYSVKSQRYVSESMFEYVCPPEIESVPEAKEIFVKSMEKDCEDYNRLTDILFEKHFKTMTESGMDEKAAEKAAKKKAIEDARYVLPNACETKLIMTMDVRSLKNFFAHRSCERAQWEIRALSDEMLRLVKGVAPNLFKKSGPSCVSGPCPEGKMSCGKAAEKRKKYLGE